MRERYSVAPQVMSLPQPAKHLKLEPSDVQPGSPVHTFVHVLPTTEHAEPLNCARSRHMRSVSHSEVCEHCAPAGSELVPHAARAVRSAMRIMRHANTPG